MEFTKLHTVLNNAIKLNEDDAWFFAVDNGVKEEIIKLNTIDQLYDKGIDSLSKSLGKYSGFTVEKKKEKGQKYTNITLKDTGDFYKSFKVTVTKKEINISANPLKDDSNLFDDFGTQIVGLTDENTIKICELILDNILIYVKKQLLI
jgi:hypothetical protein